MHSQRGHRFPGVFASLCDCFACCVTFSNTANRRLIPFVFSNLASNRYLRPIRQVLEV